MANSMFENVWKVHMIKFLILNNYTFVFKGCHYVKQICLHSVLMLYLPSHLLLSFACLFSSSPSFLPTSFLAPSHLPSPPIPLLLSAWY